MIVSHSFWQSVIMLEAPFCLWFPVLYSEHVLQIVLYSLAACMGGDCAGCWQHVLVTCSKTEKTFKVSWLGWEWETEIQQQKIAEKEKKNPNHKKKRGGAQESFGPETVFLFGGYIAWILSPGLQLPGCYNKSEEGNTDWNRKNRTCLPACCCCCCCCVASEGVIQLLYECHQLTWVTDTGVAVPVVTAVAVLGTRVGITRVIHFTALPYVNLDSLFHVECRYVCRCLSHSYSLVTKDNYFKIRVSFQSTVLCVSLFSSINKATF